MRGYSEVFQRCFLGDGGSMVLGAQSEEDVGLTGRSGVIHDIMNLSLEWSVDDMGLARGVKVELISGEAQVWVWCSGCRWPSDWAWTLGEGTLKSQDVDGQSGQGEDERLWAGRTEKQSWGPEGRGEGMNHACPWFIHQIKSREREDKTEAELGKREGEEGGRRRMTTDRMGPEGDTVMRVRASRLRRREEWN